MFLLLRGGISLFRINFNKKRIIFDSIPINVVLYLACKTLLKWEWSDNDVFDMFAYIIILFTHPAPKQ